MTSGRFRIEVFSGRGLEIESIVSEVTVPSEDGEIGMLADHRDYVGLLGTGLVNYSPAAEGSQLADTAQVKRCLVSGGLCTFKDNVLTLLADTVDDPESLDPSILSQDTTLLKAELEGLSLFDPEWEVLSQRLKRIEALRELAG
jgi:F0F1-type ATP synthase epsilon subunit